MSLPKTVIAFKCEVFNYRELRWELESDGFADAEQFIFFGLLLGSKPFPIYPKGSRRSIAGNSVGNAAVVWTGNVETKDVEPYIIAAGSPAKVLRVR